MNIQINGVPYIVTADELSGIVTLGVTYTDKRWRILINFMHRRNQQSIDTIMSFRDRLQQSGLAMGSIRRVS